MRQIVHSVNAPRPFPFSNPEKRSFLFSVFLFFFAFLIRAWIARHGNPFCYHNDEHWIFTPAFRMAQENSWDPQWYTYPPLLPMIFRAVISVINPFLSIDLTIPQTLWLNPEFTLPHQFPILYIGRLIIAVFGSATVVLMYQTLRIYIDDFKAFIFAFLYCIFFRNIQYTSFLRPEPLMMFFLTATLYALCRYQKTGGKNWLWLSGIALGFAAGAKYNAGFFILSCLVFLVLLGGDRKNVLQDFLRIVFGSLLSFLISTPQIFWKSAPILADISKNYHIYKIGQVGDRGGHGENFLFYLDHLRGDGNLSLFFIVCAVSILTVPLIWKKIHQDIKPVFATSLFFIVSYVFFLCMFHYRAERNLIIIFPFIFFVVSLFLFHIQQTAGNPGKWLSWAVIGFTLFTFSSMSIAMGKRYNQPLPQDRAIEWFHQNVPAGSKVLKEFETPLINPRKYKVGYIYAVTLLPAPLIEQIDPDYLILSKWVDNAMKELPEPFFHQFYDWIWSKTPDFEDENLNSIPMGIQLRVYNFRKLKPEFDQLFAQFLKTPDQAQTNQLNKKTVW